MKVEENHSKDELSTIGKTLNKEEIEEVGKIISEGTEDTESSEFHDDLLIPIT